MAIRICWSTRPREWMRPVAYAFEASLKEHYLSLPVVHRTDTLVVQLSVLTESTAANGQKHVIVDESSDEMIALVAEPTEISLRAQPLLSTSLGEWILEKNLLGIVISVGGAILVGLDFVKPNKEEITLNEFSLVLESRAAMASLIITMCCCLYFVAHVTAKDMIRACMCRFDVLQIVCSVLFYELVLFFFEYLSAQKYNVSTKGGYWFLYAFRTIASSIGQIVVAMLDAWTRMGKRYKAFASSLCICLMVLRYWNGRWIKNWDHARWCLDEAGQAMCVEPQWLYCGALMNCIMFQSKFVFSYIQYYEFAILYASYVRKPNMQVHDLGDSEDPHNLNKQPHSCMYGVPNSSDQQVSVGSCMHCHVASDKPIVHTDTEEVQSGREETVDPRKSGHDSNIRSSGDNCISCKSSHQSNTCRSGEQYTTRCRDDLDLSPLGVKLEFEVEDEQLYSGHQASSHSCNKFFLADGLEASHKRRISACGLNFPASHHRQKVQTFFSDHTSRESRASSSEDEGTDGEDPHNVIRQLSTWNGRESKHKWQHVARASTSTSQEEIRVNRTQHHSLATSFGKRRILRQRAQDHKCRDGHGCPRRNDMVEFPLQQSKQRCVQQLPHNAEALEKTGKLVLNQRENKYGLEKE